MVDKSGQEKDWLTLHFHTNGAIKKPNEIEDLLFDPPDDINLDNGTMNRILGSMFGLGLGDALGASTEFRPHQYMVDNPVKTLLSGGTWGLEKGQFTDDTSMSLCLGNSLVAKRGFVLYDQLVRYKWWFRHGYMSSTGHCFDIGAATRRSIQVFEEHQQKFLDKHNITSAEIDSLSDPNLLNKFDVYCSEDGVAGNGALMRLAPVPLFFYRDPVLAVKYSGRSAKITHGDQKAIDACRYYGALIVAAVRGESREDLLSSNFYRNHLNWFGGKPLHPDIENIANGSFKKEGGYDEGIRGKGYVVDALKAALWAFWQDNESFENGALAAVNLGDDTDTTAAIYGQLAGACYGYDKLPERWRKELYAKDFLACLSEWIFYEGKQWYDNTVLITEKVNTNSECFHPTTHRNNLDKLIDFCLPAEHSPSNDKSIKIYFNNSFKSCEDVRNWIESLNEDYEEVGHTFEKHNIDGYWLLNHITDENLQKYGVQRADYRRSILNSIEDLKQNSQFKTIS